MLVGVTGLHQEDQKLIYKEKERDSKAFLDISGVKDRSKILLVEDPISQEKRLLEMRKNAKLEKASKSISQISLEVDRLAGQVILLLLFIFLSKFLDMHSTSPNFHPKFYQIFLLSLFDCLITYIIWLSLSLCIHISMVRVVESHKFIKTSTKDYVDFV